MRSGCAKYTGSSHGAFQEGKGALDASAESGHLPVHPGASGHIFDLKTASSVEHHILNAEVFDLLQVVCGAKSGIKGGLARWFAVDFFDSLDGIDGQRCVIWISVEHLAVDAQPRLAGREAHLMAV